MKTITSLSALAIFIAAGLAGTAPVDAAERALRVNNQASKQLQVQRQGRELRAAGNVQRNTQVTLPDGRQASREHSRTVDRDNGTWSATTVTTDAQGRVGTRNVTGTVDRDSNSYTREVTGTTRAGVDYTRSASGSRDPETGSFQRQIDSSNSLGQSASTTITGQRNENGLVRDRTTTLGDGRSASSHTEVVTENGVRTVSTNGQNFQGEAFSRTATTARTENGIVRDVQASGPNGERSRHDEVVRDAASGTVSRTSNGVNANGEWTANAVTTRTENGYVREASRTNANGQTVSQSGELVRNDDGSWVRTQTTTNANGGGRTVTVNGSIDAETGTRNRDVTVERNPPPASGEPTP